MSFLKNPKNGWVSIVLGDYSRAASYLTDVPFDCLDAMIYSLKEGSDFCVSFDGEGQGDFKVVSDDYRTYLIEEGAESALKVFDITRKDIAKSLCEDIETNLNEWVFWNIDRDEQEEVNNFPHRCGDVSEKLATLKGLINVPHKRGDVSYA